MAVTSAQEAEQAKPESRKRKIWIWVIVAVACVVIALGVGLGVGLTRDYNNAADIELKSRSSSPSLEVIESLRAEFDLPGYAVGQSKNETFASLVTGVRKIGAAPPITPSDTFHLGSMTKAMTATLLASFIREGLFSWSTTIADALPELSSAMDPGHRNTTLAMLTSHYSGINDTWHLNLTFVEELYNPELPPPEGRLEMARRTLSQPPAAAPNTTWNYANMNYIIVGLVLDLRTSASWEEQMQSRLFTPLDMTGCGFGPNPEASNTSINNPWPHYHDPNTGHPTPFEGFELRYRDNPLPIGPAGTVHCPMQSYANVLRLHIDGVHQSPWCPPWYNLTTADFQFLHTPYSPGANSSIGSRYTPGGFWIGEREATRLEHNGSNLLNAGHVYLLIRDSAKESSFGFAFTNMGPGSTGVGRPLIAVQIGVDRMTNGSLDLFAQ